MIRKDRAKEEGVEVEGNFAFLHQGIDRDFAFRATVFVFVFRFGFADSALGHA